MEEEEFFQPGSTPMPFEYIDRYMPLLTSMEWRVLLAANRLSWGEGQFHAPMPLSKITVLTGASQVACIKALKGLKEYGLLTEIDRGREGTHYAPQTDFSRIDTSGLEKRKAEKVQANTKKTESGRESARKQGQGGRGYVRSIPDSEIAQAGFIYIASSDIGFHKIGISRNPQKRVTELGAQSPLDIALCHYFPTDDMVRAEAFLHRLYNQKRHRGEWFRLSEEDVAWLCSIKEYQDGRFIVE